MSITVNMRHINICLKELSTQFYTITNFY